MSHTKHARTDHPIHELLSERWSPYAFSDRSVPAMDVRSLFEAARWAASSYNEQPWRYIIASKDDPSEFERLLSCLVEGNQVWARAASFLAIGCTSLKFARNGKPNDAAQHDLGLASANLTYEAAARGLFVHQMIGILPGRVRELYGVPEDYLPLTGVAIGYLGDVNDLPENLRPRDLSERTRKPLSEFVFSGKWGEASGLVSE